MFQFLVDLLSSAYIELVLLIILVIYFVLHRRDYRLKISGVRVVRMTIAITVFIYFMFIWASTVQPTLRSISIFGMFAVNLIMCYYLVLSKFEAPYRDALLRISTDPEQHDVLHDIWRTGKRFNYARYTVASLFSGTNPFEFLHDMATERVREDIKDQLRHYGLEQKLISFPMMLAYLKSQLACDENMPADFKDVMQESLDSFAKHPWLEEQINQFLVIAMERPEDLHFPEWMAAFEQCVTGPK
ncbi:MAG: hypothetical protein ACYC6G_11565 [Desulfobaccales bacterium]